MVLNSFKAQQDFHGLAGANIELRSNLYYVVRSGNPKAKKFVL